MLEGAGNKVMSLETFWPYSSSYKETGTQERGRYDQGHTGSSFTSFTISAFLGRKAKQRALNWFSGFILLQFGYGMHSWKAFPVLISVYPCIP